jgi:hypothetical protein
VNNFNDYDDIEPGPWEQQSLLPLRERDSMWWAAVALPTVLLTAWAVATILWLAGVL